MSKQGENSSGEPLLRLRSDLRCSLQENNGEPHFAVEDLASGRFFRLGVREWTLASRFDGATSLPGAIAQMESEGKVAPPSIKEAESIARSLLSAGLLERVGPDGRRSAHAAKSAGAAAALTTFNPFFLRIPLVHPDRLLTAVLPWCGWLLSWPFFLTWLAVLAGGAYCIGTQWQRFTESALIYLAPHCWIYLWLVWCFLKIVHEFFHGIVCKKFGGYVGSSGVALILFSPVAFVDVTSAWRFRSKWPRIFTSAAGIYIEVFIASVAAIVWSRVDAGAVSHVCQSIVIMAGLTTILFNANPLMRFDGYFILSDLLEFQNLYGAGQQFVRGQCRRWFLGYPAQASREPTLARRWFVSIYGVSAAIWRILVCLSMILLATTMFRGAGVIVALLGVVLWFGLPAVRFVRSLLQCQENRQLSLMRFTIASAFLLSAAFVVFWLPWPGGVSAPAIVAYSPEEIVRTAADGFIEKVHVSAGQQVDEGRVLVTLRNDDLLTELADAKLQVQQSEIRTRVLLHREDQHAAYQAEMEQLAALTKRHAHLQGKAEGLAVRAPRDGVVLGNRLHDLSGRFTEVGTPLLKIARENRKEIQVSIPESHYDAFAHRVGSTPRVIVRGRVGSAPAGRLAKVEPQATVVLRNPALGSVHGGPLTVREASSGAPEPNAKPQALELAAPRFHGVVSLPPDEALRLSAGQIVKVCIHDSAETVGRRVYRTMQTWIQNKLNQGLMAAQGS